MRAEFEEKQYEIPASIELALGPFGNRVFPSGQVIEKILGYDVAADADPSHLIWQVLNAPRPPGVILLPSYWTPQRMPEQRTLPAVTVSLILQFKRPEHMVRKGTSQWNIWNSPYYRFVRTEHQHLVLKNLEFKLAADALVRYAAPAFSTRGELEGAQLRGEVLRKTGFASPAAFGPHKVWTYQRPGTTGRPNPSGTDRPFESFDDIMSVIANKPDVSQSSTSSLALKQISNVIRYRNPVARHKVDIWTLGLERSGIDLTERQFDDLRNYASIQSELARIGAHWWLVDPGLPPQASE